MSLSLCIHTCPKNEEQLQLFTANYSARYFFLSIISSRQMHIYERKGVCQTVVFTYSVEAETLTGFKTLWILLTCSTIK
jgi:hypothetical protein